MSEKFKRQLEQYENGTLPNEEQREMEQELEKLDIYQKYLDETMRDEVVNGEKVTRIDKIIKKAKKKTLFSNVMTTVLVLLIGNLILQQISFSYVGLGRLEHSVLMDAAIYTTMPNVTSSFGNQSHTGLFQRTDMRILERQIGNESIHLGELTVRFRFNNFQELHMPRSVALEHRVILYPTGPRQGLHQSESFGYLEQLPEETMAEVYISFDQFMTPEEVSAFFAGREISLDWMAVYSGAERIWDDGFEMEVARVGFPYQRFSTAMQMLRSMNAEGDYSNEEEEFCYERECLLEMRQDEFMFALSILRDNSELGEHFLQPDLGGMRIGWPTDFNLIYDYIAENGILIPGVVVTGPTMELLALRDEPWISQVMINDVTFLNWTSVLED